MTVVRKTDHPLEWSEKLTTVGGIKKLTTRWSGQFWRSNSH
ncbi:MAG: hypothetical protein ACOX2M_02885 [Fastidiosipilaceae bacterium]